MASGAAHTNIVNVTVSNDWTYFGWAELPTSAHCAYRQNRTMINVITHGYHGGALPDVGPAPGDWNCTKAP
jgi:hypothetical protein